MELLDEKFPNRAKYLNPLMSTRLLILLFVSVLASKPLVAQSMLSSELLHELHKLKTVGSVLYVAAHPDDENTAMLAYLAQEERLDTAYLSLTRGGGGQNLIGPELKEGLGLIRANELLQARTIDGATQLFTRARDFGYSKNPEDTLENWQEEMVLGDVVYAVRYFKPDVIITRFNPVAGPTHGHHTVSAQLAVKAFTLAADPSQFPEQLKHVSVHQAKRVFWNGYSWRRTDLSDESREVVELEIGLYNPYLGTSYTEISAQSRSMHKSQGFGRAGRRGPQLEKLVLLAGEPAAGDFLHDIDTTWHRYKGGDEVDMLLGQAIKSFDAGAPWKVVPKLVEVDAAMDNLVATRETRSKRATLHRLIGISMGLHVEATADTTYFATSQEANLKVELINRSPISAQWIGVQAGLFDQNDWPQARTLKQVENINRMLPANIPQSLQLDFAIAEDSPLSQPYWLENEPSAGVYHFDNPRLLELEDIPAPIGVTTTVEIEGRVITLATEGIQKISDPVKGEVHKTVTIRPQVELAASTSLLLFEDTKSKQVELIVSSNMNGATGTLVGEAPSGWTVSIESPDVRLSSRAEVYTTVVTIDPPEDATEGTVAFRFVDSQGKSYSVGTKPIEYEHIGYQPVLVEAVTKLVRLDLKRGKNRIAFIEGVGDTVPGTLALIGYDIERIAIESIDRELLSGYDTVILGPRVFDAHSGLDDRFPELAAYIEEGGTLISQYNTTSSRAKSRFASPYPLLISRERVSEENVPMRILEPEHPVFNFPNKISDRDFENWIQERGLYFASSWDSQLDALISANDRYEPPRNGGLLVGQYGKGWYAYTGLSFFRQLPEGNAGAIRLFVNLISLGHGN